MLTKTFFYYFLIICKRYTFKFYPIQKIVHSNMEEVLAGLKPFVDKAFQQGEFKPKDETEIKPIKVCRKKKKITNLYEPIVICLVSIIMEI